MDSPISDDLTVFAEHINRLCGDLTEQRPVTHTAVDPVERKLPRPTGVNLVKEHNCTSTNSIINQLSFSSPQSIQAAKEYFEAEAQHCPRCIRRFEDLRYGLSQLPF